MNKVREGGKEGPIYVFEEKQKYRADLLKRFYMDLNATFNDNQ